jgi:hypothetical protein
MTNAASVTDRAMTASATSRCQLCERLIRPSAEIVRVRATRDWVHAGCLRRLLEHSQQATPPGEAGRGAMKHSHGPQKRTPDDRDVSPRIGLLPHPSDRPCGLAGCN